MLREARTGESQTKDKKMQTIQIGNLFNNLAKIEAEKGKAKLAEKTAKDLQSPFVALANGTETRFVSESGQELASVKYQTRASLNADVLLELGVSAEIIAKATVQSAPFAVFRIH